jgi:hypothetical protein
MTAPFEAAFAHHRAGRLAEAEAGYRRIIDGPQAQAAHNNLLGLLKQSGRWSDFEAALREAMAARPRDPRPAWLLGCHLLSEGRWAEGWPLYEARRAMGGAAAPNLPIPEWSGDVVSRLIVWPEQGFGDMIQFARYLPVLRARGISATILCQPALARLFAGAGLDVVAATQGQDLPEADAWAFAGSLPRLLGPPFDVPPPLPMVAKLTSPRGIGVAAQGLATHANDANRSLPAEVAARLLALPGARSLLPQDSGAGDFQDTADIIAGLDLVISVDTASAHLAASMGKPTLVLLPALNTDWRWMRDHADSPWYPAAQLLRQTRPGDWSDVLAGIEARL